jgi:hypothetical protein
VCGGHGVTTARRTEGVLTPGPTSFGSVARRERGTRSHAKSAAASARPPKNIWRRDPLSAFASRAEKTEPDRGPHVMEQACDAVGGEEWLPKGPTRQCHGRRTGARSALVWAEIKFVGPSKYNIFSFFFIQNANLNLLIVVNLYAYLNVTFDQAIMV